MKPTYSLGFNEFESRLPSSNLWRSIIAEFLGIFILNFFSCAACIQANGFVLWISMAFGLSVFVAISTLGHVSGCHINPAITLGLLVIGKISIIRSILYIIAQCAGAVTAVYLLKFLSEPLYGTEFLGQTTLNASISSMQGVGIEFFLGFLLVLVVCGVTDENKPDSRFMAALAIGLTVTLGHLAFAVFTGSSMNPARTFGTSFVTNDWTNHWIYWIGPISGGCFASILYTFVFAAEKPEKSDKYSAVQQTEEEMIARP